MGYYDLISIFRFVIMHRHHPHPLITRLQEVSGLVSQHLLRQLTTELPEGHGSFHLPRFLQLPFSTLQVNVIRSNNRQSLGIKHRSVTILKTVLWNMAFLDEVANAVNLVVHNMVQIPVLVYLYVLHPFVVTSNPLIHDVVV